MVQRRIIQFNCLSDSHTVFAFLLPGTRARRDGVEVAGWTVDRKTRLTLTACGPSDGKEVKDVFGRPGARVGVGSAR